MTENVLFGFTEDLKSIFANSAEIKRGHTTPTRCMLISVKYRINVKTPSYLI